MVDLSGESPAVRTEATARSAAAFQAVIADAANIQYDHYLLYYTRGSHVLHHLRVTLSDRALAIDFELGRLLACKGDKEGARKHLELVMSGKPLETPPASRKVSLSFRAVELRSLISLIRASTVWRYVPTKSTK